MWWPVTAILFVFGWLAPWFSQPVGYQTARNAHHLKLVDSGNLGVMEIDEGISHVCHFIKHVMCELILFLKTITLQMCDASKCMCNTKCTVTNASNRIGFPSLILKISGWETLSCLKHLSQYIL